jgi:hypothetical protein
MTMNDKVFISRLNEITKEHGLKLPILDDKEPASAELSSWARFLELCVKKGISLGDARWNRVTIKNDTPQTKFVLEGGDSTPLDSDFRVGLQLLLGMLHEDREDAKGGAIDMP